MKAIITLRSGKEVDQPMPKPVEESKKGEEFHSEHILLEKDSRKYNIPPPFPQALRGKKKASQQAGILEVLRQVKANIHSKAKLSSQCTSPHGLIFVPRYTVLLDTTRALAHIGVHV